MYSSMEASPTRAMHVPSDLACSVVALRQRDTDAPPQTAGWRLGAWSIELPQLAMTWSDTLCAIHEIPSGFRPCVEDACGFFAPEHRDAVRFAFGACINLGRAFDLEAEIVTAADRRTLVRVVGQAMRGAGGTIVRVQGALQDVSAGMRAAEKMRELDERVEERVAMRTAQLQAAKLDMEASSASIAHDLRSPLSAISGYSKMLEAEGGRLSERGRHFLRRIRAAASQMDTMTEGLLALAWLSRAPLREEAIDLAPIAGELLTGLQERDAQRQVQVNVMPRIQAQGDVVLLTQVLSNLLSNAWKFTARQARAQIEVGMKTDPDRGRVYFVKDNGAGFDMAHASRLFEVFQRLHSTAEFEGTGVGLATVVKIIGRHGGHIWAESTPGLGAAFYFTLRGNAAR